MRLNAIIAGVGMTPFGKHMDTGLKALGREALLFRTRFLVRMFNLRNVLT